MCRPRFPTKLNLIAKGCLTSSCNDFGALERDCGGVLEARRLANIRVTRSRSDHGHPRYKVPRKIPGMTESTEKRQPDTHNHSRKRLDPAKRDLQSIINKIDDLGISSRAVLFSRVKSQLRTDGFHQSNRKKYWWSVTILITILYLFLKNNSMWNNNEKCLLETPIILQKVFRPPEDCSVCLDVQQVEKLADVDPVLFEERYAYSGRPVVITDALVNWSATNLFSYSFFKTLYDGQEANCQFFPYKSGFKSLQDVFNMSTERALQKPGSKPWYVGWSNCDENIGTILREHYDRPYFLPPTAESEKTDWIFMGSTGYGAPMHVDDVAYPSWQAQIRGTKLWILEPPRECHYTCNRVEVTVQPGEIIILDTNRWYHETNIISEEMSITIGAEYD